MAAETNLLTQVANLAGTATDSVAVETWLLDGARQTSKYGKMAGKIGEFVRTSASFLDGGTTSASVDDLGEIVEVTRGGGSQAIKVCRYVDHHKWQQSADADSIYYENSAHSPIYSILPSGSNSTLYVSPTPVATTGLVNIKYIPEYAIDSNDNIDYFPRKYYHLCIYYAAVRELGRKLKDATITLPAVPVSPAGPSFAYTDASVIDLIHPLISTSLLDTQPSALSITTSLPVAPAMSEKSVSISGTAPTYIAPIAPVLSENGVSIAEDAPTYIAPVFTVTSVPTITDLSITASIPVAPALSSTTIVESGLTDPTFIPPVMGNLDFSDTENWITTEEDSEMLSARVQEIQSKIGEYSAKLGESQAQFTKENTILNKDLQIALENARMSNSEDAEKLQKYSAELQSYQAQVGKEVQEWQLNYEADMAVWNQENSLNLQKYQTDLQNAQNTFNQENVVYQASLQEGLQEAQLKDAKQSRDLQNYSNNIQNALNIFQEESAEYQAKLQADLQDAQLKESKEGRDLQKYSQELQAYTSNVGTEVQEYSQNFARWQADAANDLQIAVQNIQSELTVKQANMSKDAQINLQNAVNNFQQEVQEYQSDLAKYQADLGKYQAELGANVQVYQAEVAGLQIKLQQCQAMYQEAIQLEFQISLQADTLDKQGA
jgi:histone H3/H4